MAESTTATIEVPRQPRFAASWPAPVLTAVALLLLAHVPLLYAHLHLLWLKPHYELFPIVFLGAAVLVWPAYEMVRAGFRPSPSAWNAGRVMLALNLVLLTLGVSLDSPWIGMISFIQLLASIALLAGGWPVLKESWRALFFLLLVVPPPLNLDGKLVFTMQEWTSRASSRILDYLSIFHYLDGNIFEIGSKRYLVDKACSGINSLFSTLAVTLFYLLWTRAHWFRSILLILAAVFWVLVFNVIRVSLIVLIDQKLGIDLAKDGWHPDKGEYYQHTLFGFALFGMILALVASTDRFLMFLGTAVRWGSAGAPTDLDDSKPPEQSRAHAMTWGTVAPVIVVYGLLLLFQVGERQLGAGVVAESELTHYYNSWTVDDMPAVIQTEKNEWQRQPESTFEKRDVDSPFGAHSRTWRYKSKNGIVAVVSFDYPFPEWHDLRKCYRAIGWNVRVTNPYDAQPNANGPKLPCVAFEMAKPYEERGYGWFVEFDQSGTPIPTNIYEHIPDYSLTRWGDRWNGIKERWMSLAHLSPTKPRQYEVLQVQVLVENFGDLPEAELKQIEQFFIKAAEIIRAKCVAGPPR